MTITLTLILVRDKEEIGIEGGTVAKDVVEEEVETKEVEGDKII